MKFINDVNKAEDTALKGMTQRKLSKTCYFAVPHAPWVEGRKENLSKLVSTLGNCAIFSDREPNWSWSYKMWKAALDSGEDYLVQLQDDVEPCPYFWKALAAMLCAVPDQVIALQGAHPAFRELANDGRKWARSTWLVGVGYVIPRAILKELCEWREALPDAIFCAANEDDLIGRFLEVSGRQCWHPIPTLIKHNVSIKSAYGHEDHMHREATVTWERYSESELCSPDFWNPAQPVPLVTNPHLTACWFCHAAPVHARSQTSGAGICRRCLSSCVTQMLTGKA